ncbi:MAG: hypothetical protein D6729_03830, partial [Deltaproteobacteria bacterium]
MSRRRANNLVFGLLLTGVLVTLPLGWSLFLAPEPAPPPPAAESAATETIVRDVPVDHTADDLPPPSLRSREQFDS